MTYYTIYSPPPIFREIRIIFTLVIIWCELINGLTHSKAYVDTYYYRKIEALDHSGSCKIASIYIYVNIFDMI